LQMEGIPDRQSARLSRGPRGTGLGGLWIDARLLAETRGPAMEKEEATGMPEASGHGPARRKTTPPREHRTVAEVRGRA
jgi:hypothetical protein